MQKCLKQQSEYIDHILITSFNSWCISRLLLHCLFAMMRVYESVRWCEYEVSADVYLLSPHWFILPSVTVQSGQQILFYSNPKQLIRHTTDSPAQPSPASHVYENSVDLLSIVMLETQSWHCGQWTCLTSPVSSWSFSSQMSPLIENIINWCSFLQLLLTAMINDEESKVLRKTRSRSSWPLSWESWPGSRESEWSSWKVECWWWELRWATHSSAW